MIDIYIFQIEKKKEKRFISVGWLVGWLCFTTYQPLVGYLMQNLVNTYILDKYDSLTNSLQIMIFHLFVCSQSNDFKCCYLTLIIQFNISHLFTIRLSHVWKMIRYFFLTHIRGPNRYYFFWSV